MTVNPDFKIVCEACDTLGIILDDGEGAPSSMPIRCSGCGAVRGTLGDLRQLARTSTQSRSADWAG